MERREWREKEKESGGRNGTKATLGSSSDFSKNAKKKTVPKCFVFPQQKKEKRQECMQKERGGKKIRAVFQSSSSPPPPRPMTIPPSLSLGWRRMEGHAMCVSISC